MDCLRQHTTQVEYECFNFKGSGQGPRTLVLASSLSPDGNILSVGDKRFRWRKCFSSPWAGVKVSGLQDRGLPLPEPAREQVATWHLLVNVTRLSG